MLLVNKIYCSLIEEIWETIHQKQSTYLGRILCLTLEERVECLTVKFQSINLWILNLIIQLSIWRHNIWMDNNNEKHIQNRKHNYQYDSSTWIFISKQPSSSYWSLGIELQKGQPLHHLSNPLISHFHYII